MDNKGISCGRIMAITRIKVIGYTDLLMVVCELIVVITTTSISLHVLDTYHNHWNVRSKQNMWTLSPNLTWIGAGVVSLINVGQMFSAIHLLRASETHQIIRVMEIGIIKSDWLCWNTGSMISALLWCIFFEIPLFLDNKWPLTFPLVFFAVHGCIRAVLAYFVKKMAIQVYPAIDERAMQGDAMEMHHVELEGP